MFNFNKKQNKSSMKDQIYKALGTVIDPDIKKDLVTLNMIKDLELDGKTINFTIELTTPACPLKDQLKNECIGAIHQYIGEDYEVEVEFSSQVTSQRKDNQEMLSGIKNIIAVSSGKGGVGKSTIATNLAIGLSELGAQVGLLDSDIHGPSLPTMLNLSEAKPEVQQQDGDRVIMEPVEQYGIKTNSIGMLIDPNQPVVWRGPMVSSALKQLFLDTNWGELDYLVVDLPPGTGDIHLTLTQQFPVTGALMVTTPQKVSISDVRKSVEMFKQPQIDIPLLGFIENMSYFIPEEFPDYQYNIFGQGGGEQLADVYNVPLVSKVPLVMGVSDEADEGKPAVLKEGTLMRDAFLEMAQKVAQRVAIVNSQALEQEAVTE